MNVLFVVYVLLAVAGATYCCPLAVCVLEWRMFCAKSYNKRGGGMMVGLQEGECKWVSVCNGASCRRHSSMLLLLLLLLLYCYCCCYCCCCCCNFVVIFCSAFEDRSQLTEGGWERERKQTEPKWPASTLIGPAHLTRVRNQGLRGNGICLMTPRH